MGKLTIAEKEDLRKAVLTASLQHFTTSQTVDFVHDKLGCIIIFIITVVLGKLYQILFHLITIVANLLAYGYFLITL